MGIREVYVGIWQVLAEIQGNAFLQLGVSNDHAAFLGGALFAPCGLGFYSAPLEWEFGVLQGHLVFRLSGNAPLQKEC